MAEQAISCARDINNPDEFGFGVEGRFFLAQNERSALLQETDLNFFFTFTR
jgi:hypothetical protein